MKHKRTYPVKALLVVGLISLLTLSCGMLRKKESYRPVSIPRPSQATSEMEKQAQAPEQAAPIADAESARRIRPLTGAQEITGMLKTVYFDYDKSNIRDDQRPELDKNAEILLANPNINVLLEGHCDERGTVEYNFALGGRRATAIKDYLTKKGIAENRLATLSKGEEEPMDPGHTDEAWAKNRRVEFIGIE